MRFVDLVRNMDRTLSAPMAGFPGVALTGSTVAENLNDAGAQARSLLALHKELYFDVIFPMMDLTVEAEALGAVVDWETDEMPCIRGPIVTSMEDAEAIAVPAVGVGNRLGVFVETCRLLRQAFPERTVWAYALGPFSIAGRLMGMTEISIALKLEPEVVHAVLRRCTNLLRDYAAALLDVGVDGVMLLEPASSLLRVDDADEFSSSYVAEIVNIVKSRAKAAGLHNCGNIDHLVESLCATGIDVLSVGSVTDPRAIYPRLGADVVVMGNVDPTEILLRGTPDAARAAVDRLTARMADCTRFVLSSGCDIPPGTSIENLRAFELVDEGVLAER